MISNHLSIRQITRILIAVAVVFAAGCAAPRDPVNPDSATLSVPDVPSSNPPRAPSAVEARVMTEGTQIATSVAGRSIRLIGWTRRGTAPAVPLNDPVLTGASQYRERVLIFAGIHGSETTTVYAAAQLVAVIDHDPTAAIPPDTAVFIIPVANPDGFAARRRTNDHGVDLNRNFPALNFKSGSRSARTSPGPAPLSEPESRALHSLVLRLRPTRILALHSIQTRQYGNNYDGPAIQLAELLAGFNGYPVLPTIGYDTPGSFGSWAGIDLQIPTITLEFPGRATNEQAWAANREALLAFIRGN